MPASSSGQIIIIGGGAAGFFAAIACAEANSGLQVILLEKGKKVLQKVKVSGGGRCNVTHACYDPRELVKHYPRGDKALIGPFNRFAAGDTVSWFFDRGVELKTEEDGRMFPVTDDSQTIIDCLMQAVRKAGVRILTGQNVTAIDPPNETDKLWQVTTQTGTTFHALRVMIATGSNPRLWELLRSLGHSIVSPVPSLFTFNIKDPRISTLAGVSVPLASIVVEGEKLSASGPLLITHWGMSGPAILRLSAWGARKLHRKRYNFSISVNWLGTETREEVVNELKEVRTAHSKKQVRRYCPFPSIPKRLWEKLTYAAEIPDELRYADLNNRRLANISQELTAGSFEVKGKSTFKEEFVTAGGIELDEVDMKRFESKLHPGLFLAGEVLNIDAITGGFNFQAAWSGGKLAGEAMAEGI